MLEGGNSSLKNIAICQYFIKGYRLIVPMHTAHVIATGFKSVRCKSALNKLFLHTLLAVVGMPVEVNALMPMTVVEGHIVVREDNSS